MAEREQYLTLAVRDFMNEGGKLINAAETSQFSGLPGITDVVGGLWYGLNGDEHAPCHVDTVAGFFDDCLLLADDFRQYWLGAFTRVSLGGPNLVNGIDKPIAGYSAALAGQPSNPIDEAGVFQPTSEVLPVAQFPQFKSRGAAEYDFTGSPFTPVEGTRYAGAVHADDSYWRLARTIDLSTTAASAHPTLQMQMSWNTEAGYDNVIVEAHTVGAEDWTTLPDANGRSQTAPPPECTDPGGFLVDEHPFLLHYFSGAGCASPGSTGRWNSFTGSSGGWKPVAFDLSRVCGQEGRDQRVLRQRSGRRRRGRVRRRHQADRRRRGGLRRRLRGRDQHVGPRPRAGGFARQRRQLGDRPAAGELLRRHVDR